MVGQPAKQGVRESSDERQLRRLAHQVAEVPLKQRRVHGLEPKVIHLDHLGRYFQGAGRTALLPRLMAELHVLCVRGLVLEEAAQIAVGEGRPRALLPKRANLLPEDIDQGPAIILEGRRQGCASVG